jgi:Ca-activated chloride channel homolog
VVPKGAPERAWERYQYTFRGDPAKVPAPEEPGEYEVRYLTGQSYATLASAPIRITPPRTLTGIAVTSGETTVSKLP